MSPDQNVGLNHLRGAAVSPRDIKSAFSSAYLDGKESILKDVEIHYCLMEMPMGAALAALPPSLHPSVPAHMTATFFRIPDSPSGPFEFAVMGIGCRFGIRPRMLTTAAFASTPAGAEFMGKAFGFACTLAEVRTRSGYQGVRSTIARQDELLLDLATFDLEPVLGGGAAIKYCAPLNPIKHRSRIGLLQVDLGFEYHNSARGVLHVDAFAGGKLGIPSGEPEFVICGTRAVVDITIHSPSMIFDFEKPAGADDSVTFLRGDIQ